MAGKGTPRVTSILNQARGFRPPQSSRRPVNNSPAWDPAGAGPSVQPFLDPKHVNRKQLKREMAKLPTTNLLRGLALLSVMGQPRLMDVATKIVKRNIKLLTTNPVLQALVDNLFYWQFCAGATPAEIQRTTHELRALGYKGVIAMYAREVDTSLAHAAKTSEEVTAQHQKLVSEWMEGSMKTISSVGADDFIALKLTGAGPEVVRMLETGQKPDPMMTEALETICNAAAEKGVKITVDAEHFVQQKAIDEWTLDMMRKYNREKPVVYNTYQMYLKQSASVLESHLKLAEQEGFNLGVKLVRGAYINSDPRNLIHDTKEDTDKAYNDAAEKLATYHLDHPNGPQVGLVLATHNKDSIRRIRELQQQHLAAGKKLSEVVYAQLMGMADELSLSLTIKQPNVAENPIHVYKYFVWGTTEECMLYLLRRAEENKDAAQRTAESRRAMWNELKARAFSISA